jgi:hypothetical protein
MPQFESEAEALLAASIEYAGAESALDVWVDAVLVARQQGTGSAQDRLECILAVMQLMIERGEVSAEGCAPGYLAVALDRLADQKEREGHVPPGLPD